MKTIRNRLTRRVALPLIAVALLGTAASQAHAARFGVRVVDDAGMPVAGAAVCIGLHGNYKQFGAEFTDANGSVLVDVPNVPLIVTVSKTRFTGLRISEPARGFNLIKQVQLKEGIPGPRCRAGSALVKADVPTMQIQEIEIIEGTNSTSLSPIVTGEPSHYRVSTDRNFENAPWQLYDEDIALTSALSREVAVYLQFRRYEGNSKAWLEARSDVATVRLSAQ